MWLITFFETTHILVRNQMCCLIFLIKHKILKWKDGVENIIWRISSKLIQNVIRILDRTDKYKCGFVVK